jgi:dTDP-4-dehydrorhamnose 3,5-epimerase-like enzyme
MARLVRLATRGDARGSLIAIEPGLDIPFGVSRVYYIFGTLPGVVRGCHAHRTLRQMAVAVSGSCTITFDDGINREKLTLDEPSLGVLIDPMIWHEMSDFSLDCVLVVLADQHYDEADYIRDYADFRRLLEVDRA